MLQPQKYLFTSSRLGFRNWVESDIELLSTINNDPDVMEFFPSTLNTLQTTEFVGLMQRKFVESGLCYFAVDRLDTSKFIGFIGLSEETFENELTPKIDIAWRLEKKSWSNGFASEGATRCLEYAFNELHIDKVNAAAPQINTRSEQVMKNIGMQKVKNYKHGKLASSKQLESCVLYEIYANELIKRN